MAGARNEDYLPRDISSRTAKNWSPRNPYASECIVCRGALLWPPASETHKMGTDGDQTLSGDLGLVFLVIGGTEQYVRFEIQEALPVCDFLMSRRSRLAARIRVGTRR